MKIKSLKLENFRSFEDCTIDFEDFYTAICGKNNSGKSNIIRAILNILQRPIPFRSSRGSTYASDFPVWKSKNKKEDICITANLLLDKIADIGLIKFLQVFLQNDEKSEEELESDLTDINLSIKIRVSQNQKDSGAEVRVGSIVVDDRYKVVEILRRIHSANVIVFHNSTQLQHRFYRRSAAHGQLENLSDKSKSSIEGKLQQINKELTKAIQAHKSELQELLGRLQEKYEVGLNFTGFDMDFDKIPYEISLGDKKYELPLDEWGSGTKNRTLILTSIFNAKNLIEQDDESSKVTPIVIVEEPESFLHPSAQSEFGRILQDLSKELKIQVIATTHSPYLLSHHNPKSNVLVKRNIFRNKVRESTIEVVEGDNWKEPFELALGMVGPEFDSLKEAFFSHNNSIILLEGDIDVKYFKLLQDDRHGDNKLNFSGELYPYGGFGFLNNPVLLKFMRERFDKLVVTIDLDAIDNVKSNFDRVGYKKDEDYFVVGIDKPGCRCVEGLIPMSIKQKVNSNNPDLVIGLQSEKKEERKSAKDRLKEKYYDQFVSEMNYTDEYFGEFYKLVKKINKKI